MVMDRRPGGAAPSFKGIKKWLGIKDDLDAEEKKELEALWDEAHKGVPRTPEWTHEEGAPREVLRKHWGKLTPTGKALAKMQTHRWKRGEMPPPEFTQAIIDMGPGRKGLSKLLHKLKKKEVISHEARKRGRKLGAQAIAKGKAVAKKKSLKRRAAQQDKIKKAAAKARQKEIERNRGKLRRETDLPKSEPPSEVPTGDSREWVTPEDVRRIREDYRLGRGESEGMTQAERQDGIMRLNTLLTEAEQSIAKGGRGAPYSFDPHSMTPQDMRIHRRMEAGGAHVVRESGIPRAKKTDSEITRELFPSAPPAQRGAHTPTEIDSMIEHAANTSNWPEVARLKYLQGTQYPSGFPPPAAIPVTQPPGQGLGRPYRTGDPSLSELRAMQAERQARAIAKVPPEVRLANEMAAKRKGAAPLPAIPVTQPTRPMGHKQLPETDGWGSWRWRTDDWERGAETPTGMGPFQPLPYQPLRPQPLPGTSPAERAATARRNAFREGMTVPLVAGTTLAGSPIARDEEEFQSLEHLEPVSTPEHTREKAKPARKSPIRRVPKGTLEKRKQAARRKREAKEQAERYPSKEK